MHPQAASLTKLDDNLAALLHEEFRQDETSFPVVVTCRGRSDLERLAEAIEAHRGKLRHLHALLTAVSAWLPLSAIRPVAELEYVMELELDQPSEIA